MDDITTLYDLKVIPGASTEERKALYLRALVLTGGNNLAACRHLGMGPRTPFKWGVAYPEFKQALEEALNHGTDILEDEARRRAYDGVDEPVFYQGTMVGTVRKYSDALLMFLLRGRKPEVYRDRTEVNVTTNQALVDAIYAGRNRTGLNGD